MKNLISLLFYILLLAGTTKLQAEGFLSGYALGAALILWCLFTFNHVIAMLPGAMRDSYRVRRGRLNAFLSRQKPLSPLDIQRHNAVLFHPGLVLGMALLPAVFILWPALLPYVPFVMMALCCFLMGAALSLSAAGALYIALTCLMLFASAFALAFPLSSLAYAAAASLGMLYAMWRLSSQKHTYWQNALS